MPKHKFSIVACARWEEEHIVEWIEYHRSLGFDHIYLYSNDDTPDVLLSRVLPYLSGDSPFVTFSHWEEVGKQPMIYLHFLEFYGQETEWFSFLDIDEFFVLKPMDNIKTFMEKFEGKTDCIYFNWVIFGNGGRKTRQKGSVLLSLVQRNDHVDVHTKLICRSASLPYEEMRSKYYANPLSFWHFLDGFDFPNLRICNVLEDSMAGYSVDFPRSAAPFTQAPDFAERIISTAFIAHFQFKSEDDFIRRVKRGGFDNGPHWQAMVDNGTHLHVLAWHNAIYDPYLATYWSKYVQSFVDASADQTPGGPNQGRNVALHKPTLQSSVYSDPAENTPFSTVCGGGNNGTITGYYGFHTEFEQNPWWMIDLLEISQILEIRIFNRMDNPILSARSQYLDVLASKDGVRWDLLHSQQEPFGGKGGSPLTVAASAFPSVRFVKLVLRNADYLHLDEVEIYAAPG